MKKEYICPELLMEEMELEQILSVSNPARDDWQELEPGGGGGTDPEDGEIME